MESEQICPACATINATHASICTNCSTPLSPPDRPAAAAIDAAAAAPPVPIRPAKGFHIIDGMGPAAPRPAATALSAVEPPAPGGPPNEPPAAAPAETQAKVASISSNGHSTANGWPKPPHASALPELIFAVEGTVVEEAASARADAAPEAPEAATPRASSAPASPLAFHIDAASAPAPPPLTFQATDSPAPAPGEESGGRGWGVREQRPSPNADWMSTPPSVREDPGSSAVGVPRVLAAPQTEEKEEAVGGAVDPEAERRRRGTVRVLRVGMLVLLIVVVLFGALIHYAGR